MLIFFFGAHKRRIIIISLNEITSHAVLEYKSCLYQKVNSTINNNQIRILPKKLFLKKRSQ